ncbi:glycine betaine/L-proline ABC transporter ATP-binding protein [Tianweitania sp. BSSL-BM11]|uniref:Quaternary amine transport ATP-binding protein n=1 Tax=Tianweitania aestuarii TaxID=2814886 RepID=A0ABS5RTU6_9HYPH|nr:glycine betaine/L-proline ABC transporter ATP-binding protein [Tianweitania aestuarii]MBS9719669.1 glycine betaine/L-proline ABC transporter ATP-binding protein [Tianweitania aestuarii]
MTTKISAKNIFKIFGNNPDQALGLLQKGQSKEEIYASTGQTVGVDDVSFEVAEGEVFVVMGLSGSGKSTLVRMINGLIKPSAGEMLIDDIDVASCSRDVLRRVRREKVAMVFQHFALFPHRTVAENVAFGLKIRGVKPDERRERAQAALEQVGLGTRGDSFPDELSGGMQQRVGLARGLASEPEILLMDEPFGALDPLIRSDMQQELLELQRSLKKTIVFITHDLNEALILGNTIAIMRNGSMVQIGTAEQIVSNPADDYVAAFTRDVDRSLVFTAQSIADPAQPLDLANTDATAALAHMETHGLDAVHMVDHGKLAGIVTYRDANTAVRDDVALKHIMQEDMPTASAETLLVDLYPLAEKGLPIALTDDEDRLDGVVAPQAVFAQLSNGKQ